MQNRITRGLLVVAALAGVINAVPAADEGPPKFKITAKRDNDQVDVKVEKGKAIFSIRSPFGISDAVIERLDEKWPTTVVLRLHLKGLEHFRASNGKARLEAAALIQNGIQNVRVWKDGKEDSPLDSRSPLWTAIRIVGSDGKAARNIPLEDGYFEIPLPKAFFAEDPKSITVRWIDFYRN